MRKTLKDATFILLSVVVLFLIAVGAILALRVHRQHVTAEAVATHTPKRYR